MPVRREETAERARQGRVVAKRGATRKRALLVLLFGCADKKREGRAAETTRPLGCATQAAIF